MIGQPVEAKGRKSTAPVLVVSHLAQGTDQLAMHPCCGIAPVSKRSGSERPMDSNEDVDKRAYVAISAIRLFALARIDCVA
jgi:hypothetical protein